MHVTQYYLAPKKDITPYELAIIIQCHFFNIGIQNEINIEDIDLIKRHLKVIKKKSIWNKITDKLQKSDM
jgi:hypothetical protein